MATTTITIRVPVEMVERLDKLAESTERSKSWLAARALAAYLETEEWQIAQIRRGIKEARRGKLIPHDNVAAWLRSWGSKQELPPPKCK